MDHVRSFLGLAGYYCAFVRNFASTASPLRRLLKKDTPFIWHDAQIQAFETLKHALTQAPVLAFPDYTQLFTLCTDASALGIGAVLMQSFDGPRLRVIDYASRVLNSAEFKYSVTHLESFAVVWALKHFRDMIFGYLCGVTVARSTHNREVPGSIPGRSGKIWAVFPIPSRPC